MADYESIQAKLVEKEPIELSGTTIDDQPNPVVTLDPADKLIRIDQILVDARFVTTSLRAILELNSPFGLMNLENYDRTILTGFAGDVIDGAPLYIKEPLTIYLENTDDEDVAWNMRILWKEVEDNPPTQLDSEPL